jgi:4-amino-4-deoxy-L-arabinose transferase-like glycosyltransferase
VTPASPTPPANAVVSDRAWRLGLLGIIVVFLALRIVAFIQMGESVFGTHLLADALYYQARSLFFTAGVWQQEEAFFMSPAYPIMLGLWYKLTSADLAEGAARILNMILSGGTLAMLILAARQLWSRGAALAAGALWTLSELALFYEQTVLMEIGAGMVTLAALWAGAYAAGMRGEDVSRKRLLVGFALTGFLTGLSALFRGNTLALFPLFICILPIVRGTTLRVVDRVGAGALTFASMLIPILPITYHNYRAEHDFIFLTSNMGMNLYIGNNPTAVGVYESPPTTSLEPRGLYAARAELGREEISSKEINNYWSAKAVRWMRDHPREQITLMRRKILLLFYKEDFPQIYHLRVLVDEMPVLKLPLIGFGLLYPLAMVGAVFAWRRRSPALLTFLGALILLPLSILPFFITERYRLAYQPVFILVAAWGAAGMVRAAAEARWHMLRTPLLAAAAISLLVWPPWITLDPRFAHLKYTLAHGTPELKAALFMLAEDDASAREILENEDPRNLGPVGLFTLAGLVMNDGENADPCQAMALLELAAARQPDQWEILAGLGGASYLCGNLAQAKSCYHQVLAIHGTMTREDLVNLFMVHVRLREPKEATEVLDMLLIQYPGDDYIRSLRHELTTNPTKFLDEYNAKNNSRPIT